MNENAFSVLLVWVFSLIVIFAILPLAYRHQIKSNQCNEKPDSVFVQTSKGWVCLEAKVRGEK